MTAGEFLLLALAATGIFYAVFYRYQRRQERARDAHYADIWALRDALAVARRAAEAAFADEHGDFDGDVRARVIWQAALDVAAHTGWPRMSLADALEALADDARQEARDELITHAVPTDAAAAALGTYRAAKAAARDARVAVDKAVRQAEADHDAQADRP